MTEKSVSRRRFLGGVAAIAASPYLNISWVRAQTNRPAASNRITIGCIGMGGMGSANMNSFLNEGDAQVVAVCDVDKNHLKNAKDAVDNR
ncbi:MAG: hypothetical protein JWN98_1347, partial [Abditibacteriota bacterium]|nr:hypothetical protein [Abditibacteriota bacterium]